MEEENKKTVEEQNQVQDVNDEKYLNLKRSNNKKNIVIIVLVFILLLMLCTMIIYYLTNKGNGSGSDENNTSNPTNTSTPIPVTPEPVVKTLSDDEAIKIAKEKHNEALNLIAKYKDGYFDTECTNKNKMTIKNQSYCYYGEENKLKENFYKVFSSRIAIEDVYNFGDKDPDDSGVWKFNYVVKNGKVYFDTYCRASGYGVEMKNYKIESITSDKIEVSFTIYLEDGAGEPGVFEEKPSKIILVMENGEWKISNTVLLDRCHNVYTVGKES